MKESPPPPPKAPRGLLRQIGAATASSYRTSKGFVPLVKLLASEDDVTRQELGHAIDRVYAGLYQHPLTGQTRKLTAYLRKHRLIPNEQSTEDLLRFLVEQMVARSPMPVPQAIVDEFWHFFGELFSSPEIKGLGDLSLDMTRMVLKTYEPLLVEIVNLLKAGRRFNEWQFKELMRRAGTIRHDAAIVRRQIRALRHIKPFFQADPKDFKAQAKIVAGMVGEFGPFFIKMAQVAAASADFLPEEIARELAVFHEDVPPMSPDEVEAAFVECYGARPHQLYLDFDASRPLRSGSIGSVYVAKKPFVENGLEVLRPVVIKVGRHNLDREFTIGKLVLGLAIMSSQYWAPHSKLTPFLRAMQGQVDEFITGFMEELDFEREASNQQRFYERSLETRMWRVPRLYRQSRRVLEMEYLADSTSLTRALRRTNRADRRRFQAQVAERLIHAVLSHVVVHGELHGDLHPGNVMVAADGTLHLIDWGNVVNLEGQWRLVWDYLAAALLADTTLLADTLIRMSTEPEANRSRRQEIIAALDETLAKKGVARLTPRAVFDELREGGLRHLYLRGQTVLHLLSNTQQAGLVVRHDYLHLSRALFSVAGSLGALYEQDSKRVLAIDVLRSLARLPYTFSRDLLDHETRSWRSRVVAWLPLPGLLRARLAPPPRVPARVGATAVHPA